MTSATSVFMIYCYIMKERTQFGIAIPEVLLPKKIDTATWAVIACDQYTQSREYWAETESIVGNTPSTLNLILPEVYLEDGDRNERIEKIHTAMNDYLASEIFQEKKGFIYIERETSEKRTRKGLICAIDLDAYEWKSGTKAVIRATEATIPERIPPRMKVRQGAALESPHIMLLVNDSERLLIEGVGEKIKKSTEASHSAPLYSGKLMQNGGYITGYEVSSTQLIDYVYESLEKIAEQNTSQDGSLFLFAVGDGNHSLATAKAVWDEYKKSHPNEKDGALRYALVEIVNIYDAGLTFEPIHRVVFNADPKKMLNYVAEKLHGSVTRVQDQEVLEKSVNNSSADFGFSFLEDGKNACYLLHTEITTLAVSSFQPVLDEYIRDAFDGNTDPIQIDYIHGSDEIFRLAKKENATGILLPPIAKECFFETIHKSGSLPRKSFSMGEANEKRYYMECRKLL